MLRYDDYSGWFFGQGVLDFHGLGDFYFGATYDVSWTQVGETTELGQVQGMGSLDLVEPDLMTGFEDVDLGRPYTITWTPGTPSEGPSIIVVDLRVYDADVDDPSWLTEVWRLVTWAYEQEGGVTLPFEALDVLPAAENRLDANDDLEGYWGEMSIVKHQLRRAPADDGDLVIDFVHAINAPVTLSRSE